MWYSFHSLCQQIVLNSPSGNIVLADPFELTVMINANDDHNGVLSLQSLNGGSLPLVQIDEGN